MTYCLEGSCSIQLSYRTVNGGKDTGSESKEKARFFLFLAHQNKR
jgi:hypothetical protein